MKKILYICTNHIENWDNFIPSTHDNSAKNIFSVVFLHNGQNLDTPLVSKIFYLKAGEQSQILDKLQETISYQEFLEEIFSHDLSVVL